MQLPKGATVAVADGEKFNLFRNDGDEAKLTLSALAHDPVDPIIRAPPPAATAARPIPTAGRTRKTASPPASSTS